MGAVAGCEWIVEALGQQQQCHILCIDSLNLYIKLNTLTTVFH